VRRPERVAVVASAAIIAACVVYLAQPPAPIYYPLEHVWRWTPTKGVSMLWYGRSAWSLIAGLVAGFVANGLLRRSDNASAEPSRLAIAASVSAVGALLVALGYTVLHEWSKWVK